MRILEQNNNINAQAEQKTVNIGNRIDRIIELANEAKFIMGDDIKQRRKLTLAQNILNKLIDDLRDEDANIVYFSGTFDELMAKQANGFMIQKEM